MRKAGSNCNILSSKSKKSGGQSGIKVDKPHPADGSNVRGGGKVSKTFSFGVPSTAKMVAS